MSHADYLRYLFDNNLRKERIRDAKAALKKVQFDGILVSGGVSGMFGATLAHLLNKKLVVARKPNDNSHSPYKVENIYGVNKLLFVDDLISTGKTLDLALGLVEKQQKSSKLIGAYFYEPGHFVASKSLADILSDLGKEARDASMFSISPPNQRRRRASQFK